MGNDSSKPADRDRRFVCLKCRLVMTRQCRDIPGICESCRLSELTKICHESTNQIKTLSNALATKENQRTFCLKCAFPMIKKCDTDSNICQSCESKLHQNSVKHPCHNKIRGCNMESSAEEIKVHEKHCSYKGIKCAEENCQWIGKLEEIVEHWSSKPNIRKIYKHFNICRINITSDKCYINIVRACGQIFWFKLRLQGEDCFWAVQYLGNNFDAKKYMYRIEIIKSGDSNLKIIYNNYCQALDIDNNNLFSKEICITANINYLKRFIEDNRIIVYHLKIYKAENVKQLEEMRNKKCEP